MYKCKLIWLLFVTIILTCNNAWAQDVEFTQFINNPVYLNEGMYGINGGPRIIFNYRNQWPALQKAFETYAVSYDQHFDKIGGGVGVQLMSDNQANGILRTTSFSAGYSHLFRVDEKTGIRAGMSVGLFQKSLDWSRLLFYDQFDLSTTLPTGNVSSEQIPDFANKTLIDIGAGIVAFSKHVYGGIALKHLNQPNESYYKSYKSNLPIRISGNFGAEIKTKKGKATYISPNIMFTTQAKFTQVQGNVLFNTSPILFGIGYRHAIKNSDAVVFFAGIRKGVFKTVYSYDNTYSNLRGKSGGAHELSLILNFSEGKKAASKRLLKNSIDCPDML